MLTCHKTTEEEKRILCTWTYEGEYAIYNALLYDVQRAEQRGFANPKNNYYSFYDGERLIGYINLVEEAAEVLFGVAVHPRYCSRGYGQAICKAACALSQELYPDKPVALEVRTWNTRAIRCYERAGFRIIGEPVVKTAPGGEGAFFRMRKDGQINSARAVDDEKCALKRMKSAY